MSVVSSVRASPVGYTPRLMMTRPVPPALLVRELPSRRTVAAGVWLVHGAAHDPAHMAGATHLLEHLTLRRCGVHDRRSLARLIDRVGSEVDAWTSSELMGVSVETTLDALGDALGLLVDAVVTPTFDPADVELERRVSLAELDLLRDDPAEQVEEAILRAVWGDHPLARPVVGSAASLRRLTPAVLRRHHAAVVAPHRVIAAVAGDVDPGDVAERLAVLPLATLPESPPLPAPQWVGKHISVVRRDSVQVHARLAFPAPASGDSRLAEASILNRLLGVGASSRLFQRLREDEGLTYDIWSGLLVRQAAGLLEVGWTCSPEVFSEVWKVVKEEVGGLASTITFDEVEVAKEGLLRGLQMEAESPAGLCGLDVSEVLTRGRRFDAVVAAAELTRVSAGAVAELARESLRMSRMATAICGPEGLAERVA